MLPITTNDLAIYIKYCGCIGRTPTLAGWIAVETQDMNTDDAKPYEAEMVSIWGDLDMAF